MSDHLISRRMEKIRFAFQHALQFSSSNDEQSIDTYLNGVDPEFRAVAYEGASMSFALKDLHDRALMDWRAFMRRSEQAYVPHVHVGLGWAIAKLKLSSLIFLDTLKPSMIFRVLDGHGYYDGVFRQVQTINNQRRPVPVDPIHHSSYDQGVGRSLWYSAGGDVARVSEAVRAFSTDRHPALWRGVGVAAAFVGGCDEHKLDSLLENSADQRKNLIFGAAMAIKARVATNTISADTALACQVLLNLSAKTISHVIFGLESISDEESYSQFLSRLNEIESQLFREVKTAGVHKENE